MPDMHAHHHGHGDDLEEHGPGVAFTGERVLPDLPDWAWCFQAHLFGYEDLAARIGPGMRVLDVGCGEGYGAARLAETAKHVSALDVAPDIVAHAAQKYRRDNLSFAVSEATRLPYAARSFDVVCSLQVIEHLTATDEHLAEVARVLKPEGFYYVTTPNIDKMGAAERDNPYHLRDFTPNDLRVALMKDFDDVTLEGMFYVESSPRHLAMTQAERKEQRLRPRLQRIERALAKLPGPARVRLRPVLRRLAGVPEWPLPEAERARNAILAEDFYAGIPAEDSFCLVGVARKPR